MFIALFTACSKDSVGGSKENTADGNSIEFKIGHMNSPDHVQDKWSLAPFSEDAEKATDGRVTFQIYPGGALGVQVKHSIIL
ncbi:hypothetical protein ACI2OX_05160 [Bacillus sp. N9]